PSSAHASTSPNVNVEPPRIGAVIRYHTSSASRNTNPVTAAAPSTYHAARVRGCGATGASSGSARDSHHAMAPIATLNAHATHGDARVPTAWSVTKLGSSAPATAPSVSAPYNSAAVLRASSSSVVAARAAAGSVPPIASTGTPITIAASTSRSAVAPRSPSV